MPPIKTLARESHFLASIFFKTLIFFSKTHHNTFARFLHTQQQQQQKKKKKNLSLVSSKAKTIFPI